MDFKDNTNHMKYLLYFLWVFLFVACSGNKHKDSQDYTNDFGTYYEEFDEVEEHLDYEDEYADYGNQSRDSYENTSVTVGDDEYEVNIHENSDGSITMQDNDGYSASGYSDGNGVVLYDNEGRYERIDF